MVVGAAIANAPNPAAAADADANQMGVIALQQQPHVNGNCAAVAAHLNTLTVVLLRAMCAEKGISLKSLLLVCGYENLPPIVTKLMLHAASFEIVI